MQEKEGKKKGELTQAAAVEVLIGNQAPPVHLPDIEAAVRQFRS